MALTIEAHRNRRCIFEATVRNADDDVWVLGVGDYLRCKVGRPGATPVLDLSSLAASANGSTMSPTNPTTITLDKDDVVLLHAGTWTIEVSVFQAGSELQHAVSGMLVVLDTQTGSI